MKFLSSAVILTAMLLSSCNRPAQVVDISRDVMENKVKGAWAGKMIGVMYGRPMEFAATDRMYTDSVQWQPENVALALKEDDIYGQMNFMMTMEQYGQDVAVDSLAKNFANAEFSLCHANLQARKNYFDSVPVTELASPANSIHCEDIDFQIECDFIGFVNPCMPQSANEMCERVGSIMASGDGLYAGMYICALHTMAFDCNNIDSLVTRALGAIPAESGYAACIRDVIEAHAANPDDWTAAWQILNDKWASDDVCTPYLPFNIDAKLNGAYVVTGLLYGDGDWEKTMGITIGCGQDTDCNTATAAALLGIISGYDAIPDRLKSHIPAIADECFDHTNYSFNKAVSQTLAFIDENVTANGGKVTPDGYSIVPQQPVAPEFKKGFQDLRFSYMVPVAETDRWNFTGNWEDFIYGDGDYDPYKVATTPGDVMEIPFTGTGVAILGSWNTDGGKALVSIDGNPDKTVNTYYVTEAGKYQGNRAFLYYNTGLDAGDHMLRLENLDIADSRSTGNKIYVERILVFN